MTHLAEPAVVPPPRGSWAWIPSTLRVLGIVVTLATIAGLEYGAGLAAGWGTWGAAGVPGSIDPFVLGALLARRSRLADRLFALGLVEATVVVSAVAGDHAKTVDGHAPNVWLGAALASALVFALWRQDETIRRERNHGDLLAQATARADAAERRIRELEDRVAAAERRVGEAEDTAAQATADAAAAHVVRDTLRAELEQRAVAAEARAAELDRRLREEATEREERRRDRGPRQTRPASSTTDDPVQKRRAAIRGLVEAGNPNPSKRDAVAAFERAGVGPGDNSKITGLIADVLTEIAAERATAAGHPNLVPLPAATAD